MPFPGGGFERSYREEFSSVRMVWAGRGGRDRVSGRGVCDREQVTFLLRPKLKNMTL